METIRFDGGVAMAHDPRSSMRVAFEPRFQLEAAGEDSRVIIDP